MKQAHLGGRLKALRPSQQRQLAKLSHHRHFSREEANFFTLEKLAKQTLNLQQPLHLFVDNRGLCRLLWVGNLEESQKLLAHLSSSSRQNKKGWRLISCHICKDRNIQNPNLQDAIIALDLHPISWLIYDPITNKKNERNASLWKPDPLKPMGWNLVSKGILKDVYQQYDFSIPKQDIHINLLDSQSERVLILTLQDTKAKESARALTELEDLVRSAGAEPVAVISQKKGIPNSKTIWGIGKLQEVALEIRRHNVSLVITDRELTPGQARNLEDALDCAVMDRSELILDIFAQRASSASGRLQVELAQLRYRLPRLIGRGRSLSRQGGGIGTRGPGETQLEKDRRAIAKRINHLQKEIKGLERHRARLRKNRNNVPKVALVGYTNAGKSSLLNALCDQNRKNKVHTENKLFATLDPTTRRLVLPRAGFPPNEILVTDTVGFIKELPETLKEAFKSTLEETLDANLILIVVDLGDHHWPDHLDAVNSLLDSIDTNSNRQLVANQIDRCDSREIKTIQLINEKVLYISAISGAGIQSLKSFLHDQFWSQQSSHTRKT